jgi:hypothetical protein
MKSILMLAFALLTPLSGACKNHSEAVEHCIAQNSGADSVDCLNKIFDSTVLKIDMLEQDAREQVLRRLLVDRIGETHYDMSISALDGAAENFDAFSHHQCEFVVGNSGAVASGSGQIYWSCRIGLNDQRIEYLERLSTQDRDQDPTIAK